ncbi:hypothetical protein PC123_g13437 [Phytophthora cactorum]|nr:hypothetical protein PC120_g13520 [Phytophthora cactorum]KAG4051352.1 hypothetical protein PC123_g13437 [Phytophthora cactorum]
MHEWHQRYQHIVDGSDNREELCISPPGWYLPDDIHSSLFCCLRHSLGASCADYVSVLTDYMQELAELEGLFDDEYVASLRSGELAADELGLFAASRMHNCYIEVIKLNYDCKVISKYTYTAGCATRSICIACIGPYFTLKVDGLHV